MTAVSSGQDLHRQPGHYADHGALEKLRLGLVRQHLLARTTAINPFEPACGVESCFPGDGRDRRLEGRVDVAGGLAPKYSSPMVRPPMIAATPSAVSD